MKELLTTYSLTDILVFIVMLAIAYKGACGFFDWLKSKRKKDTLAEMKPEELEKKIQDEIKIRQEEIKKIEAQREQDNKELTAQLTKITDKIDLLISSDKDDIKAYITREYHFFIDRGWIDDYSMDCLEKRYDHYVKENGNSFIGDFMRQLRNLPRSSYKD